MSDRRIRQGKPVTWAKIDRIETPGIEPNAYEFRRDIGWHWLQRACFAILGWIGAHKQMVYVTFTRHPQENDDLLKTLAGNEGAIIDLIHNADTPLRIYMGPDDFPELAKLAEFRQMQHSTVVGRIETRSGRNRYGHWHNIPITVVPWMKGAVIVPAGEP